MANNDELIKRAADSLEFLESTGGGKRVQAQVIRDLAAALREADRRVAELEECVRVARRAVELGNDSIARVDRILASWHKVFPGENPAIARRMVEDRVRAESAQIIAELERDRERLDWLDSCEITLTLYGRDKTEKRSAREAIDAAMAVERGK